MKMECWKGMDKEEYRKNAHLMLYLASCAVNSVAPGPEKMREIDLEQLFKVCESHVLTAVTAYALETAGIQDHAFTQAKEKAIRKNILLDAERSALLKRLEAEHIWYMPLKGAILKDWYPKLGMRQMSDNDILCDKEYRKRIREIMQEAGFTLEKSKINVEEYSKKPVHNFEMHFDLFTEYNQGKIYSYYETVKDRLIRDAQCQYGYHFSVEDFYLYMTAHEYKHYAEGGTGVRSLLDVYILMRKFGDTLDMQYIAAEAEKMGIAAFEKQNRELAMQLFGSHSLTDEQMQQLDYYIFSGAYGTFEHSGKNRVERAMQGNGSSAKLRYLFQRLFPPMDKIRTGYPFFYQHKWLIPVLWLIRPFRALIVNRGRMLSEIKHLISHK